MSCLVGDGTARLSGIGSARHGEVDLCVGQTAATTVHEGRRLGDLLTNELGDRGGAEFQGGRLYARGANVSPLDSFILLCLARFCIDAVCVEDMSTIHQGSWDASNSDCDRWRDGERGAVALRSTACIKVVVARIIARRVLGQDHALAGRNRERAPEVEPLAARNRGMVVDRDTVDHAITRATIVEPDRARVVAVWQRATGI